MKIGAFRFFTMNINIKICKKELLSIFLFGEKCGMLTNKQSF